MRKVRTSTKLLILIVIGILASILIFDLMVKQRFVNGKFTYYDYQKVDTDVYTIDKLSGFKHIIINGILRGHNGALVTEGLQYWRPRLKIDQDTAKGASIDVPSDLGNSVLCKVVNDTLHISFDTKQALSESNSMVRKFRYTYVKVHAPQVNSLTIVNAYVYLNASFGQTNAYLSHSILSLDNAKFNNLNITAEDASKLKVDYESKIGQFSYALCNSNAYIAKDAVAKFTAGTAQGNSKVNIVDTLGNSVSLKR